MTLNDYQKKAMTTCMYSCYNFSYMFINLVGEVGEFASKIAKAMRKEDAEIRTEMNLRGEYEYQNDLLCNDDVKVDEIKKEAGDILWQLSGLCEVMGWELEDVAQMNLDKLAARKKAGTIDGNGDGILRSK